MADDFRSLATDLREAGPQARGGSAPLGAGRDAPSDGLFEDLLDEALWVDDVSTHAPDGCAAGRPSEANARNDSVARRQSAASDLGAHDSQRHADLQTVDATDSLEAAARDVRLFRARVAEALDELIDVLLVEISASVVARELHFEPCDLRAVVRDAMQRLTCDAATVILHPLDADVLRRHDAPLAHGVQVECDTTLRRGDAILRIRGAEIDARLGVRLDGALRRVLAG